MRRSLRTAGALILLSSSSTFAFSSSALHSVSSLRSAVGRPIPGASRALGTWSSRARSAPVMNLFGSVSKGISNAMRGGAGGAASGGGRPYSPRSAAFVDGAPSWETLKEEVLKTDVGKRLAEEKALREMGGGPPHTMNKMRLFGQKEEDVRVVLYRDAAAWCPYCQKVWLLLEEKQLPYRVEKINMRSYGEKPDWFMKKMPRGLLPVVEIDGKMVSESIVIMQMIDQLAPSLNPMLPSDQAELARASKLMNLERDLFGAWCGFTFQPGGFGRKFFEDTLSQVDKALQETSGPWILGGDRPSLVDFQYVSHVERMVPSVLYWKGLKMRGDPRWAGITAWLEAFEKRPAYVATKSDYYTHIKDIPPQYGPGDARGMQENEDIASQLDGRKGWTLPLEPLSATSLEPEIAENLVGGEEAARHEALFSITSNGAAVARFCARAAGEDVGEWYRQGGSSRSELADPLAAPNLDVVPDVDACLRYIAHALLVGPEAAALTMPNEGGASSATLRTALDYLRKRVGVPRDMSFPAARQFRAHIAWMLQAL
mmetsp:Transcript_58562/g.134046  ORF Transcript_58562/g.134046 Transcript_58562/m.134046 type:complete len:543 (-) Transcript_58562:165-1793(-)